MRKKVLFVLPSLKVGGAEKFVCNLARSLSKRNFVTVYLLGGVRDSVGDSLLYELIHSQVKVEGEGARKAIGLINLIEFHRFCSKSEFDVIFSTVIQSDIAACFHRTVCLFTRSKCGVVYRRIANSPNYFFERGFEFFSMFAVDALILCAPVLLERRRFSNWIHVLAGARIQTIVNGIPKVSMAKFQSISNQRTVKVDAEGEFSNGRYFCAGKMEGASIDSMQKGFDIALGAIAMVVSSGVNADLSIYGTGPLKNDLLELSCQLGIEDAVRFIEPLPIEDVLVRHDVLILPSRFEGLSNVVIESLLAGCYVFLSDIPENRIFSRFGEKVRFFENTSEALAALLIDFGSTPSSSTVDPRLGEFFSMYECVDRYQGLIDQSCGTTI